MDITHPGQTVNDGEKIINIVVIQQNDENDLSHPQDVFISSCDTHVPGRPSIVNASPNVRDYKLMNCLSSCKPKDKSLPRIFSKSTPKVNSISRQNLYKSQSLTLGQSSDEVSYSCLDDLKDDSVFSISSLSDINISSGQPKQMENNTTYSPQQNINRVLRSQACGKSKIFSKHRSINIPVNHNRSDALSPLMLLNNLGQSTSPLMLVNNLGQSTINSLVATPDSGFCTPSSCILEESFSVAAYESSTPRTSRDSRQDVWPNFKETVSLNKVCKAAKDTDNVDHKNESPLDKSLNCVQWLQTYSIEEPLKSPTSSQSNQSSNLVELSCNNQSDQVGPTAMTELLAVPSQVVSPFLNFTSTSNLGSPQNMSVSSDLQKRIVLQELDTNRSFDPNTVAEPKIKAQYERPSYSYMDLIKIALKHSADGQLTVKEILTWIEVNFPYFKHKAKHSWKSSVRCNLSMHSDFTKVEDKKRGGKWKVADDAKSYMHRLPKPPVIKQPKVPAVTSIKPRRSGPLPILPRSVPYALVPLPLTAFEQGNPTQQLQQQALQIVQTQHQFIQLLLHQKQQLQDSLNTSQQLSSSSLISNSQDMRPRLQQIAPKLQQEHTSLTWDPKTFIICDNGEEKLSSTISDDCRFDIHQRPENVSDISVNTSSQKEAIIPSSNVLQPVSIQIQPGNKSNEKKIIFYLKQHQDKNHFNKVAYGETNEQSSPHNTGDAQVPTISMATSSKARGILKTVDKIQRSKSFDNGYRNVQIRPYNKGKREDSGRIAPVMNLESLLTENKENEKYVEKIRLRDEDDDKLVVDLCEMSDASNKTLPSRSDSAPTKCLIQEAWDKADLLNDSMENDSCLFSRQTSSISENCNGHDILAVKLDKRVNSENLSNCFPHNIDHHSDKTSKYIFQPIEIPQAGKITAVFHATSSIQLNELEENSCRQTNSRSENPRSSMISQGLDCIKMQTICDDRTASVKSEFSLETNKQDWSLQVKNNNSDVTSTHAPSKTMSASKIVFNGLPNSYQGFTSSASPIVVKSVNTTSSPQVTSSQQEYFPQPSSIQCPPQPRFYRTKSRRKQIHTPLTTDISPGSAISLSEASTTEDANRDKLKVNFSIDAAERDSPNATGRNLYTHFISPSRETDQCNQTTSSPNSDNPSPLNFSLFLSNLSSSSYRYPCIDSTTNLPVSLTDDKHLPISSLFPVTTQSSKHASNEDINVQDSSLAMSQEINVQDSSQAMSQEINVEDSSQATSQEMFFLSPQPSSTSTAMITLTPTPTYMISDPHLYPSDTNFLISSPHFSSSHCHKENVSHSPSDHTLDHFLSLTSTPPAGDMSISISSTPTRGIQLPLDILHAPHNSSGFLDSSLFDTLDSLMQNSVYEFKTP